MKYLKTYKIFESIEHRYATSSELETIDDILVELKDLDFEVEIHKNIRGENYKLEEESEVCRIYIEKIYNQSHWIMGQCNFIPDSDFISVLQHLVSYVNDLGYNILIESVLNSEVKNRVCSEDGEITDTDINLKFGLSDEYYKRRVDYMKIIIYYKD